ALLVRETAPPTIEVTELSVTLRLGDQRRAVVRFDVDVDRLAPRELLRRREHVRREIAVVSDGEVDAEEILADALHRRPLDDDRGCEREHPQRVGGVLRADLRELLVRWVRDADPRIETADLDVAE